MARFVCFLLSVWYSIQALARVDGHDYLDEPSFARDDHEIMPIQCARCGHREEGWW